MSSSIAVSFLGALEASLSVLLTLTAGVIAARFGLLGEKSAKDVSKLCVNMFLPALLIVNIGKNIGNEENDTADYGKILLWSLTYTGSSALLGHMCTKFFKLPAWTTPAVCFNNTTSLPLLLIQALEKTGFLSQIINHGSNSEAVERAKSFFLVNAMASNALTFAVGPKLLALRMDGSENVSEDESDDQNSDDEEPHERTSLLPRPVLKQLNKGAKKSHAMFYKQFNKLPAPAQHFFSFVGSMVNAPLVGAIIALVIGLSPPLRKAFFADPDQGGIFTAWLTSAVENVGDLFTALQMFVVGTKLNAALEAEVESADGEDVETGEVPKMSLAVVFFFRFIFWSLFADLAIWVLASKAGVLGSDPILWFAMMLMPVGPPAMILSSLAEEAGQGNSTQMAISKMLVYLYAITPVFCFPVVGALKLSQLIMRERGI